MRKLPIGVLAILMLGLGDPVWAEEKKENLDVSSETLVFEEMIVTSNPVMPETESLDMEILDWTRHINVGDLLDDLPGVNAVRRGASSTEPVIRGLGWERVQTQVGPIPVFGGCPARMDPPIGYLQPDKIQKVTVVKGVPSVTLGPGGTGGRIVVSTDYERDPSAPDEFHPWISTKYDGSRNGFWGGAGARGGNKLVDAFLSLDGLSYGDYESASGKTVPADKEEYGGAVSIGVRPFENHRWWNGVNFIKDKGFDAPSLPMDSDGTDTLIYNTGYRMEFPGCPLEKLEFDGGLSFVDHSMSNSEKANRSTLIAESETNSDSYAGRAKQDWRINPKTLLTTGTDFYNISRDANRDRFLIKKNKTFIDHIWPDANQWNLGNFAELNVDLASTWDLRIGGRIDYAESDADAVDDVILGTKPIRQYFVDYYGSKASDVHNNETLGSGNVVLEWKPFDQFIVHTGGGVVSRAASITERFYAFSPSTGGYQIGNPALDPEIKYEIDLGADWVKPWGVLSVSAFHYWVNDYIMSTLLGKKDVDGDGVVDLIRGYTNVDARLYGFEIAAVPRPFPHWSFPMSLSYVRGEDLTDDDDLPEIPPLEGRVAVRFDYGEKMPWWVEVGGVFVSRQDAVSESFGEDETPGYGVMNIYAGIKPMKQLSVMVGVENLLNKEYTEHLTREAVVGSGDLLAGDEIPAPGTSFQAMVRYEF
ncbi:MAG: TonB-dependent receptor domain-containing protein [Acidobacteriota bacterium]